MKILLAEPGVLGMTQIEIDGFLASGKMIMRLATVDSKGDPVIHPVWYLYQNERIYLFSSHKAKKLQNIARRSTVYFSIDADDMPNKGVKGKGRARIVTDDHERVSIGEQIVRKYMEDSQTEYAKGLRSYVRTSKSTVVEIIPQYYTVWDYSKMM